MARKKKEDIIEKIKEKAEAIVEKVEDSVSKSIHKAEKIVDEIIDGSEKKEKKTFKKSKLEELKEKAKELEAKVSDAGKIDIKERVTGEPSAEVETLVPIEDYLKSSMHLGTRVITPPMRKFIYKRRADGLAVFNTSLLDKLVREGAEYLSQFSPEQIVIVCKREAGWSVVSKFAEKFGIKFFTKKYPSGILTNTNLEGFFERDLVVICDPWLDKNALTDANRIKMKVFSICDSNNYGFGIDKFIIGNNKSGKSLGMIFYLLGKLYAEKRGLDWDLKIEDFIDDWDSLVPPK